MDIFSNQFFYLLFLLETKQPSFNFDGLILILSIYCTEFTYLRLKIKTLHFTSATIYINTSYGSIMLRTAFNIKSVIHRLFLFLIILSSTEFLMASGDWVYDLRYKEFLVEADNGSGAAMYELGVMTERGRGTDKNIDSAINWYEKAIQNDNSSALVRLGKIYLEGISTEKNYDKALGYLKKAEKKNSYGAYYYLAVMYENGYGVKIDLSVAKLNYDKAAKWGHYGAKKKSNNIGRKLKAQLAKAKLKQKKKKKQIELSQYEDAIVVKKLIRKKQTKIDTSTEIKRTNRLVAINDIKKSLLTGMWFNGDSPLGFLPSPRTFCISKVNVGLRCVSKETFKNTGREKVYYLIESKISDINKSGDFIIRYKNKVTKVDVFNRTTESGENYVSRIKVGAQKKEHILKCNVAGNNVSCNKDGMFDYFFVNLTKAKKSKRVFIPGFE